jgi:hypothetical protein
LKARSSAICEAIAIEQLLANKNFTEFLFAVGIHKWFFSRWLRFSRGRESRPVVYFCKIVLDADGFLWHTFSR